MPIQVETQQKTDATTKIAISFAMISLVAMAAAFLSSGINSVQKLTQKSEVQLISAEISHEEIVLK